MVQQNGITLRLRNGARDRSFLGNEEWRVDGIVEGSGGCGPYKIF
jgi:hypothetical protein